MAAGLARFGKDVLIVLSGDDFTARGFVPQSTATQAGRTRSRETVLRGTRMPNANHTFSTRAWRDDVAAATLAWLRRIEGR